MALARPVASGPEFDSPAQTRAFDFYLRKSSSILGGDLNTEFWGNLVVPLCMNEPAIKHAVLAISNLHRHDGEASYHASKNPSSIAPNEMLALAEYGKAMNALRVWKPSKKEATINTGLVPLLACVLFTCIEFLRGNTKTSQIHIMQGRNMLAGLTSDADPETLRLLRKYLVPVYTRLCLPTYLFAGHLPAIPDFLRDPDILSPMPPSRSTSPSSTSSQSNASSPGSSVLPSRGLLGSNPLSSIEHARNELYHLIDQALPFFHRCILVYYDQNSDPQEREFLKTYQQSLLLELEQWDPAFTTLLISLPPAARPPITVPLLRMYYYTTKVWTALALESSEMLFDKYISDFSAIVSNGGLAIDAMEQQLKTKSRVETSFSFESEVIAPLYWVCIRCRQPVLRRAALELLKRDHIIKRRENLWSAEEVVLVATRVMLMEEEGVMEGGGEDQTPRTESAWEGQDGWESAMDRDGDPFPGDVLRQALLPAIRVSFAAPPSLPKTLDLEDMVPTADPEELCQTLMYDQMDLLKQTVNMPMVAPFGVPKEKRIRNTIIGPREEKGIWATTFRDPSLGQGTWEIRRHFLPMS